MKIKIFILACLILAACSNMNGHKELTKYEIDDSESLSISKAQEFEPIDSDVRPEDVLIESDVSASLIHSWELEDLNKNSDYIVRGRVLGKNESRMVVFGDLPYTSVKLEVGEVLKGKALPEVIDMEVWGGAVKIKDYMEMNFPESNEKAGLYDLSEEAKEKLIYLKPENYPDLYEGKEYIVFLIDKTGEEEDFGYRLDLDGYSIFELPEEQVAYKNDRSIETSSNESQILSEKDQEKVYRCELTGQEFSLEDLESLINKGK